MTFKQWAMSLYHELFERMGFVPQQELVDALKTTEAQDREIARLKIALKGEHERQLDEILKAMYGARMTTTRYETPHAIYETPEGDPASVRVHDTPPVKRQDYVISQMIDMGFVRRIHQDLMRSHLSAEMEFFIESLLHNIRRNVEALMRMDLGEQ